MTGERDGGHRRGRRRLALGAAVAGGTSVAAGLSAVAAAGLFARLVRPRVPATHFSGDPRTAHGLDFREVVVPADSGDLPAWLVEAGVGTGASHTWAVLVHGPGGDRTETLRALPILHRLGITSLAVGSAAVAGDPGQPLDRFRLADAQWQDVEAAVVHAVRHGAQDVVLVGWSVGATAVLQAAVQSWTAQRVRGLVLDSPVLDWRQALAHEVLPGRFAAPVGWAGRQVLAHPRAWRLVGRAPAEVQRLDWVARADSLRLPTLLLQGTDDEIAPARAAHQFADARPDLVTYQEFPGAGHAATWNTDPEGWAAALARFLLRL
ncbi:alpha/beta hydrolase [Spongisporangium articulatum]|uniref:Alpha/beta hydrolase n=1 Tax=Spongisporangium articulatum TaxID=3362603 RepID=A0ABW8AS27_9ACTN